MISFDDPLFGLVLGYLTRYTVQYLSERYVFR